MLLLQDLETYKKAAVAVAKKYFTTNDIDDFYKKKDARPLIFCHFARGMGDKTYDEVCWWCRRLCSVMLWESRGQTPTTAVFAAAGAQLPAVIQDADRGAPGVQ